MTTMNEAYGDGSPHKCCSNCGYCEACGGCNKHGCQLGPLPEPEGYWSEDLPPNYTAEQMRAYALQERAAERQRTLLDAEGWGSALNQASWTLIDSYRHNTKQVEAFLLFNYAKTILRDAILEYLKNVNKDQ